MSGIQKSIFIAVFALLACCPGQGQVTTGTPPFASFGGGPFDIVNLGNLNVHFAVPILHKTGRGMPFAYDLGYDNSMWSPATVNGVRQWQPAFNWGWVAQTAISTGYVSFLKVTQNCDWPPPKTGTYTIWSQFVYHDPWGAQHAFDGTMELDATNCDNGNILTLNATAGDGSGYALSAKTSGTYTITTMGGEVLKPPVNPGNGYGIAASTRTDRNGNQISVSATGVFTDTLGTTVLTVTGQGTPSSPLDLQYTGPNGARNIYVYYKNYYVKTNFGCTGVLDYGGTGGIQNPLVDHITFPDNSTYTFSYETTLGSGNSNYVTGRLQTVTLPTGGQVTYAYTGGTYVANNTNGITCSDGSTATLQRTVDSNPGGANDTPGTWTYAHSLVSGAQWTTTITDPTPQQNQTVFNFQGIYATERQIYQGTASGTPYRDLVTCYNGTAPSGTPPTCNTATIKLPITRLTATLTLPGGLQSKSDTTYYAATLPSSVVEYAFAQGAPTVAQRSTSISYATLGNGIIDMPATITVSDASGGVSVTSYTYDEAGTLTTTTGTPQHVSVTGSRGLATTVTNEVSCCGTSYKALVSHFTYYDTGNVNTATDVNGAVTTYKYNAAGSPCGNSLLTELDLPMSLKRYITWDTPSCNGAVVLSSKDENGNTTSTGYADANYWRPTSATDQLSNQTAITYPSVNSVESSLSFGSSVVDSRLTVDGFGRPRISQRLQGPSATYYDSAETDYDIAGRPSFTTVPYSAGAGQPCVGAGCVGTATAYDAFSRVSKVTDAGGGDIAYNYDPNNNDLIVALEPAPGSEHTKQRQLEYDVLGNLSSVCEITSASDGGSCTQNTSATGYWTKYSYRSNRLVGVSQNAQASHPQSRSLVADELGRLTSETNPETGTVQYFYDSDPGTVGASCPGPYAGDLVKKYDAQGDTTCYAYDSLHRVTQITYSGPYASVTPNKYFVYDSATLNSTPMANAKGHLAEAYTGSPSSKTTDLFFSYSVRGETTDVYEKTRNSGGYYRVTAGYLPSGGLNTIQNLVGLPTITYVADPEGRPFTVSASSGYSPIISPGTSYDVASNVTGFKLGSGDSDAFQYDGNTGRLTKYTFNIGSNSVVGQVNWNPNGTLGSLIVTDPFDTANQQTCNYAHDDLARTTTANCSSAWNQSFTFDPFGNVSKSGTSSFLASYVLADGTTNNQVQSVSSFTPSYDANGNLTNDGLHTYAWDAQGKPVSIGTFGTTVGITYDALGRAVEQARGTSYTQIVYAPMGSTLALMNGQTLSKAFVPLPAGAQAVYAASGLAYYRHPDWLGSSRFASTPQQGKYFDVAYAPYGEDYADSGTLDLSFTGQNADTVTTYPDSDFLFREYSAGEGRWASPDPAGVAAADLSDPQSWNRYAYVRNSPCSNIDPLGLGDCTLTIGGATNLTPVAQNELARIYAGIGVAVSYTDTLSADAILLQNVLLGLGTSGLHLAGTDFALINNSRIMDAAIFYAASYAPTDPTYYGYGLGLGRTVAHEVGHIFLGDSHSLTGIMRAGETETWSNDPTLIGKDKYSPFTGSQFNFTPAQGAAIRNKLGCNKDRAGGIVNDPCPGCGGVHGGGGFGNYFCYAYWDDGWHTGCWQYLSL